jgi:stearoyl-CoA desaturase (delta-9 desaturase)
VGSHHRHHHRYSDMPQDTLGRPGWLLVFTRAVDSGKQNQATDMNRVRDLAKYPELRFLEKYYLLPPIMLGTAVFFTLGASAVLLRFFASTVLLWHGTFTINSLSHVFGRRRFETTDHSRNNWLLAIVTMGEGWHNNHHRYSAATRQGFYWYEYDITYYILKTLSFFGLV